MDARFKRYPDYEIKKEDKIPAHSYLYGHRTKETQNAYEYMLEFLQVVLAKKEIGTRVGIDEYFPKFDEAERISMRYMPRTAIGLKRFVFFERSKFEGKVEADMLAYEACVQRIEERIKADTKGERESCVRLIQGLLYGFNASEYGRIWFNKNLLPVCEKFVLPESIGASSRRKEIKPDNEDDDLFKDSRLDGLFEYTKYTNMCRGGELYYLHLLQGINSCGNEESREIISSGIKKMLGSCPQIESLAEFIDKEWRAVINKDTENRPSKRLAFIPASAAKCSQYTVSELVNFFRSALVPLEKEEIFSVGIILQLLRMMYIQTGEITGKKCVWIPDINNGENPEMKKLAIEAYADNEQSIIASLYAGYEYCKGKYERIMDKELDEKKFIKEGKAATVSAFRKIAKQIGIVIPVTGAGMRFSLSEQAIKFLVTSIAEPKHKLTLDKFVESLYKRYSIIIGAKEYKEAMSKGYVKSLSDTSFLEKNKENFARKLKECGFLRDLSDATAIVENPYSEESL